MINPGDDSFTYDAWHLDNESLGNDLLRVHELREQKLLSSQDMTNYIEEIRDQIMVRIVTETWFQHDNETEAMLPCPCRFCLTWLLNPGKELRIRMKIRLWQMRD